MTARNDNGIGPVLLTGGNGFVGSRIARRLAAAGRRVRAIVRAKGAATELSEPDVAPWVEEIEGDFTRPETAGKAAEGVGAVVHCAAAAGPDLETARRVNVEGTRAMVEAALGARVRRYVQISTISVYARIPADLLDEDAPLKKEGDPYGLTKADADRVVLAAMERGLPAVILRPGAILGLHRTSTWAVRMPERIRDGQIKLRGDGRETVPWVHVEDLADAVLLALGDDRAVGRIYNVADGAMTWRRYTDDVRGWFGAPPLEEIPVAEFGEYWTGRFDASRIRRELGYAPRRSYEEGMSEAAEHWVREGSRTPER
jgi:nucleoside-diphosphate-sugar epimerase